MKRITASALFTITLLQPPIGAAAQQGMKYIPFDFTVGNTKLPAGEYTTSPRQYGQEFVRRC